MSELTERARAILRTNDRGGYAVPTARLYPFQWNWDSGFVAMGWATFDEARAWQELQYLLRGQWEDGLVPQIVFHAPSDDYFPGPDIWGIARDPPTSGIVQPPILAVAMRRLLERARDRRLAETQAAALYPRALAWHRWWERARDPARTGLVATLHPWETGMDNSPAWDAALARVPATTRTEIRRRDTAHVDAAFRPRGEEYQRFIHLVELFRDAAWQPARMLEASPFKIVDIGTNAILLRAERDLLALAGRFGTPAERDEIATRITRMERAMATLWDDTAGLYTSRDLVSGEMIGVPTSAALLPLFAGGVPAERAARMASVLRSWGGGARYLVPSTDPSWPAFDAVRYWRGPVWAVVNWMIADGLTRHGIAGLAARVREDTMALISAAGFSEYFDPLSGGGIGGGDFSWTAAIALLYAGG
jgi:hypothetical protein